MPGRIPSERSFGVSMGTVSVLAGGWAWWRGHTPIAIGLLVLGTMLHVTGRVAPAMLRVPNAIWWRFAQLLGWFNSRVLLMVFFAVVIVPVGLVMRVFGYHPLRPSQQTTSWSAYSVRRRDPRHFHRMF